MGRKVVLVRAAWPLAPGHSRLHTMLTLSAPKDLPVDHTMGRKVVLVRAAWPLAPGHSRLHTMLTLSAPKDLPVDHTVGRKVVLVRAASPLAPGHSSLCPSWFPPRRARLLTLSLPKPLRLGASPSCLGWRGGPWMESPRLALALPPWLSCQQSSQTPPAPLEQLALLWKARKELLWKMVHSWCKRLLASSIRQDAGTVQSRTSENAGAAQWPPSSGHTWGHAWTSHPEGALEKSHYSFGTWIGRILEVLHLHPFLNPIDPQHGTLRHLDWTIHHHKIISVAPHLCIWCDVPDSLACLWGLGTWIFGFWHRTAKPPGCSCCLSYLLGRQQTQGNAPSLGNPDSPARQGPSNESSGPCNPQSPGHQRPWRDMRGGLSSCHQQQTEWQLAEGCQFQHREPQGRVLLDWQPHHPSADWTIAGNAPLLPCQSAQAR